MLFDGRVLLYQRGTCCWICNENFPKGEVFENLGPTQLGRELLQSFALVYTPTPPTERWLSLLVLGLQLLEQSYLFAFWGFCSLQGSKWQPNPCLAFAYSHAGARSRQGIRKLNWHKWWRIRTEMSEKEGNQGRGPNEVIGNGWDKRWK